MGQISIYDELPPEEVEKDKSEIDDTEVNSQLIYYSNDELVLFFRYCRALQRATENKDTSTVILAALKEQYERVQAKESHTG